MSPGFQSWCWNHMWVKFVDGSLPCSQRFLSGYWRTPKCYLGKQITIINTLTVFSQLMVFANWSDLCLTFLLQARSIIRGNMGWRTCLQGTCCVITLFFSLFISFCYFFIEGNNVTVHIKAQTNYSSNSQMKQLLNSKNNADNNGDAKKGRDKLP